MPGVGGLTTTRLNIDPVAVRHLVVAKQQPTAYISQRFKEQRPCVVE
jgi:hypothetical protein